MNTATSGPAASLDEALARYWGYTAFRPLQREAMEAVLTGRDSMVVLPTGGGKSLCFQAPALVRPGLALIVSPLISLMKDQVDTLVGNGVPAACFNSSMASDEKSSVMAGLREGRFRLQLGAEPDERVEQVPGDVRRGAVGREGRVERDRLLAERDGERPALERARGLRGRRRLAGNEVGALER